MAIVLNGDGNITGLAAGGLPDASVTTDELADGSVTTAKLADSVVTQAKLGTNVAGNGPAFSAYPSTNQSVSGNTWTLVAGNTEEFDTASAYNNTGSTVGGVPAYAFLPTVAGYYQVNVTAYLDGSSGSGAGYIGIYKNGAIVKRGGVIASFGGESVSALVYLNGSTDYIQLYGYVSSGLTNPVIVNGLVGHTFFQAYLARSA